MAQNRRTRKRLAMREHLADTALRLFAERGFDRVTVEEIADAADVGRKTVFNHFPRKEDLFFDRVEEIRTILVEAVQKRDPATSPLEAYRLLAHSMAHSHSPYIASSPESLAFMEAIENSGALQARARSLRDEFVQLVKQVLATAVGRDASDPDAFLAASLLLASWTAARIHAHRVFSDTQSGEQALQEFLHLIDQGARGLNAAMEGTPYASVRGRQTTKRDSDSR